jgi:hypothetical protein
MGDLQRLFLTDDLAFIPRLMSLVLHKFPLWLWKLKYGRANETNFIGTKRQAADIHTCDLRLLLCAQPV